MGSVQSGDKRKQVKGAIYIQLQQIEYQSNEVIDGILHINLEEPFNGHLLVIQFDGVEDTRFDHITIKNNRKEHKKLKGQKKFLSVSMPIYDFASSDESDDFILMPGQWSIPFKLTIAEKLPSSIKYFKSLQQNCKIHYSLSAYILPSISDSKPIEGQQDIAICQQLSSNHNTQDLQKQIENAPLHSCCLSMGSYKLICTLNQPSYAPSEVICLDIECNLSQFTKKLNKVSIELIGDIMLAANDNFIENKERIFVTKIEVQLNKDNTKTKANITIPSTISCTVSGVLIDIQYHLLITPILKLNCLKGNDSIILPVQILPIKGKQKQENLPQLKQIQAPENWNPQVLEQKLYTEQQSLQIQQLYLEFQQQQNQVVYQNVANRREKLEQPFMSSPTIQ